MAVFLPFVIVCGVYLLVMMVAAARANVRDARKILISGCFVFILIVWTVLDLFVFRTGIALIGWTPLFLTVVFAIIFIERLWNTTQELSTSNRQLILLRDDLETTNQELETLFHTFAHDLRTPIRAMTGFSYLLEENPVIQLDEENKYYISRVKAGAKRMGRLIDELMAYMQLRQRTMNPLAVDTTELALDVINELLSRNEGSRKVSVSVGDLPSCRADPHMLRIVFTKLLENAFIYTLHCPEPQIEVGTCDGAYFVRDNGVGFEPEYAKKIFGVFERLHSIDEFEGVGMGLAMVNRIIERHGGKVWAVSEVGQGATFYFTFPRW